MEKSKQKQDYMQQLTDITQGFTYKQKKALIAIMKYFIYADRAGIDTKPTEQIIWEYLVETSKTRDYDRFIKQVEALY